MAKSNIPPRTMRQVSEDLRRQAGHTQQRGVGIRLTTRLARRPQTNSATPAPTEYATGLLRKPRHWRFQTKPLFKKVHGPLVDVFHEAEEVLIVIDLSGFHPSEVFLQLTPEKYVIQARRGVEEFREEILLPPEVDLEKCVERSRNGILEITLPRRIGAKHSGGDS